MTSTSTVRAFLSYSRLADRQDDGRIMLLCEKLENEVQIHTGIKFKILRDRKDIAWGEPWQQFISDRTRLVHFLIPIITGSYFASDPCFTEYRQFMLRERSLSRSDLVLPVYYVTTDEDDGDDAIRKWKQDIFGRQYVDWRKRRHLNPEHGDYGQGIEEMAEQIKEVLRREQLRPSTAAPNEHAVERSIVTSIKKGIQRVIGATGAAKQTSAETFADIVARKYSQLTHTQRELVKFIYRSIHKEEIAVDQLYSLFRKLNPEESIQTHAELYFRLKDLKNEGLIDLKSAGERTSVVLQRKDVQAAAIEKKLWPT